ncbi:mitochondrial ATP synthase g subunit-domain-containing protein [Papiliotrema laurentii]|uniref:Mitochondrial ATP synthase g subunit-domain-containing protein n=1 Tax=Papiliotrema laurentii TaxID=5418 RepID=A0AAD9FX36_PAPLA|nr:mitochondrial ATP synthase g subunit-domain-containing protein [Papiliotrema laurentii]
MRSVLQSLRQSGLRGVRFNSSSSSNPAQNPQVQKAVENAQKALAQTSAAVRRVAGPVGDKVGNALGGYREPLVYNAKVAGSLLRQVYQAEKLAFPTSLSTWARAYAEIYGKASHAGWWKETLKNGTWAGVGIAALEAYGIFSIGEIIGRRNLVGYNLKE